MVSELVNRTSRVHDDYEIFFGIPKENKRDFLKSSLKF